MTSMKEQRSSRRRTRRAGARGASLVEAVVVVPVFIVLFAGMLFLHHTLAKTQGTMLAARYQAWNAAMNDCKPNGGAAPQPELTTDWSGAPGSDASLVANMGDATGTSEDSANVAILGSGPAPVAEAGALDFHAEIHSQAIVTCNATTEGGNLGGVIKWFYNQLGGATLWGMIFGQVH
jgi:hypothetical protein